MSHALKHLRQLDILSNSTSSSSGNVDSTTAGTTKFVEFFGDGVAQLSIADRTTIANMCPEYGATCGFFAADDKLIEHLRTTRPHEAKSVRRIEAYLRAVKLYRDEQTTPQPVYSQVHELDLATIVPSVSGPKRSQDKVAVVELSAAFRQSLQNKIGFNVSFSM